MTSLKQLELDGRTCFLHGDIDAPLWLLQAVDDHDLEGLESEIAHISAMTDGAPFLLAALKIEDWDRELTPWQLSAEDAFHGNTFGDGAGETLRFIEETLLPALAAQRNAKSVPTLLLGGYSLAGLFALWAGYRSARFDGVAGVSPSVWYPGWSAFIGANAMRTGRVYLSLGDREERARGLMGRVGDGVREQYARLCQQLDLKCTLEWNPGNHFKDTDFRTAKGFAWLIKTLKQGTSTHE